MVSFTRRAALAALGASAVVGIGYALRGVGGSPVLRIRLTDGGGMMGASAADMSGYMEMFNRHTEISRTVEEIPGGVRTTTQSNSPDLAAQLHGHVSSMYSHVEQGAEVMCMSQSLPTLFPQRRWLPAPVDPHTHGRHRRGNLRRPRSHRRHPCPRP